MPNIRPSPDEYAPYYGTYVSQVPDGPVVDTLARQIDETLALLRPLSESQALHRYAEGKWSVKEVVGHLIDAERVFTYRALVFGRADANALPSFDENAYVPAARHDAIPLGELLDEFAALRGATVRLFRHFPGEAWGRRGTASGKPVSVRALAWITAGHERHHLKVLRERYLTT
jgi:hypothetical protein